MSGNNPRINKNINNGGPRKLKKTKDENHKYSSIVNSTIRFIKKNNKYKNSNNGENKKKLGRRNLREKR